MRTHCRYNNLNLSSLTKTTKLPHPQPSLRALKFYYLRLFLAGLFLKCKNLPTFPSKHFAFIGVSVSLSNEGKVTRIVLKLPSRRHNRDNNFIHFQICFYFDPVSSQVDNRKIISLPQCYDLPLICYGNLPPLPSPLTVIII